MAQSVGAGISAIRVAEPLTPGQVYPLPDLPVINTGEEFACYQVSSVPRDKLIKLSPREFCLSAGEVRQVKVDVVLPLRQPAGDREYLLVTQAKAGDQREGDSSNARLGVAVGTRLSFSVGSSPGVLGATVQRVNSLYQNNLGKFTALSVALCLLLAGLLFRRAFDIRLSLRKSQPPSD